MSFTNDDGMTLVDSDHIHSARHDSAERVLTVKFRNGNTYEAHGVPSQEYQQFMAAPSQGQYYHAFIKGRYEINRVK